MSFDVDIDPSGAADYDQLVAAARSLVEGEPDRIANAANLSSLIFHGVPDLNWAGFYFYDGRELVLGPFQGRPACIRIPLTAGVCGRAASRREVQRVDDVTVVADHIACDAASRSELVIPLVSDDLLVGVLDIDSPLPARFTGRDEDGIGAIADVFVAALGAE